MRVVLDTNVLLSAMFTRGVCEAVLDAMIESPAEKNVTCAHILEEFVRHASETFGVPRDKAHAAAAYLKGISELVEPVAVPVDACRDPDDRPILGASLAGSADAIVTGDRDLLSLGRYGCVSILTPREFFERLRSR